MLNPDLAYRPLNMKRPHVWVGTTHMLSFVSGLGWFPCGNDPDPGGAKPDPISLCGHIQSCLLIVRTLCTGIGTVPLTSACSTCQREKF